LGLLKTIFQIGGMMMAFSNGRAAMGRQSAAPLVIASKDGDSDAPTLSDIEVRIGTAHDECIAGIRVGAAKALEVGLLLIEAKKLVGHGKFGLWVEENCHLSRRTAQRYMQMARGPKSADFARLPEPCALELVSLMSPVVQGPDGLQLDFEGDDLDEDDAPKCAPPVVLTAAEAAAIPKSYVRMKQLYSNGDTKPKFEAMVDQLGEKFNLTHTTDIVMATLEYACEQLQLEVGEK
jgi:hypothetical protein